MPRPPELMILDLWSLFSQNSEIITSRELHE